MKLEHGQKIFFESPNTGQIAWGRVLSQQEQQVDIKWDADNPFNWDISTRLHIGNVCTLV